MDEQERLALIKEFMVALAPEVTHHSLAQVRHRQVILPTNEEGVSEHSDLSNQVAKLTLELAMHLAARYADLSEEISPAPH